MKAKLKVKLQNRCKGGYSVTVPASIARVLMDEYKVVWMDVEILDDRIEYTPIYPDKKVVGKNE